MTDPETPSCPRCRPQIEPTVDGGWHCLDCGHEWKDAVESAVDSLRKELAEARETVRRLNRRCQIAEAAANLKVEDWGKRSTSQGRDYVFASGHRYGAEAAKAQIATLTTALREAQWTLESMGFGPGSEIRDRLVAALVTREEP